MSAPRYLWRQLNEKQRAELLAWRKERGYPWHSPPHRPNFGHLRFLISASCFEHHHHIATARSAWIISRAICWPCSQRMHTRHLRGACCRIHYHVLVETPNVKALLRELGLLHGRTSHVWNGEEQTRRRKVFFRAVERAMRSDRHYWATLNYVHHNPVRHVMWRDGQTGDGAARRSTWS
jgi:putative transposase